MHSASRRILTLRTLLLAGFLATSAVLSASAQDVSESHLDAAKAAMRATGATDRLNKILPEVAAFTKAGLIANRPDIEAQISVIVDEVAISLAPRRGPLEDEVAAIYANLFTEDELVKIEAFFSGEAGEKFLRLTPNLFRQVDEVGKVWRGGITRDMATTVGEKLKESGLQ